MADETQPAQPQETTEDELRAITVGPLQPLNGKVPIVDYDPNWPRQFALRALVEFSVIVVCA